MIRQQKNEGSAASWNYEAFILETSVSVEDLCREIFRGNQGAIKIKKEKTAVKNLVRLYKATLKLSAEKGFRSMTLRDLCGESGLSMGALYSYISCKEDLLNILQGFGMQYISTILIACTRSIREPTLRLRALIRTHIYLSETLPELFNFFFMEAKNLGPEIQKIAVAAELYTEQMIVNVLEEGKQKGDFNVKDPQMTSALLKPMLQDWYLKRWKHSVRGVSVDDYTESVIELIETYLRRAK